MLVCTGSAPVAPAGARNWNVFVAGSTLPASSNVRPMMSPMTVTRGCGTYSTPPAKFTSSLMPIRLIRNGVLVQISGSRQRESEVDVRTELVIPRRRNRVELCLSRAEAEQLVLVAGGKSKVHRRCDPQFARWT